MRKNTWKRILAIVLTMGMVLACMLPTFAATSKKPVSSDKSLMEQIQTDDLSGMSTDAFAHLLAWATTNDPQTLLPQLSRTIYNSPLGDVVADVYDSEFFYVKSFDGTKISCTLFKAPDGCKKDGKNHVAILAHGFQVNQLAAMVQVPLFTELGYDVITFDQRQSGDSDHVKCTMGANESKDVGAIAKWIRARYGNDVVLGLYGQSMGAATVMMYSVMDPNLAWLIEDCGYASLKGTVKDIVGDYLPFFDGDEVYALANEYARVGDVSYDDVKPINAIRKLDPSIPALFLHGESDMYIVPKNCTKLYNAKRGEKQMKTFPLAGHSQSCYVDAIDYNNTIANFLAQYDF